MNNLFRKLIIAGGIYGIAELSYTLGKGRMLGLLKEYDISAEKSIDMFSKDDRKKLKFIAWIANNLTND